VKRSPLRRNTTPTGFSRAVVARAIDRDQRCVFCGRVNDPQRLTGHHRLNRGMGGAADAEVSSVRHCLALCWECNGAIEASAVRAAEARDRGIKLRRGDPLETPVLYPDGVWYVLDAFGQKQRQERAA
jgi:hypothetical protein